MDDVKDSPLWQHNKQVSGNGFREVLLALKGQLEMATERQKKELEQLLAAKASLLRK